MSTVRMSWIAASLLACVLAGSPATAGENPAPRSPSSCLPAAGQAPQPTWLTTEGCYDMTLCPDDDYCRSICSIAITATCFNSVCQFTLPGGGVGGGSHCPEQRLCSDDFQCIYNGGAITGSCINNLCVC